MLSTISKRIKLQMHITLKVSKEAITHIASAGFDQKYGARPLRRSIQTNIEDKIAEEILASKIKQGDYVTVKLKENELTFSIRKPKKI
jgi:ATP-dependent Clp protease ATP-binding subunit ClpC